MPSSTPLYRDAAAVELDPAKRAAMFIRMNDLVCEADACVIPIVHKASRSAGYSNKLVAELSGWDQQMSTIADWYRA